MYINVLYNKSGREGETPPNMESPAQSSHGNLESCSSRVLVIQIIKKFSLPFFRVLLVLCKRLYGRVVVWYTLDPQSQTMDK